MAVNTWKTFLMQGTGSPLTWAKLLDIIDYPEEGAPNGIDVTTLTDGEHHYIPDIKDGGQQTYTANYSATDYAAIKALEGTEHDLAIWFGGTVSGGVVTPDGSEGKWTFKGYVVVTRNGGGVGEARQMTVTVYPTSDAAFSAS